jgi:hypothetical protein
MPTGRLRNGFVKVAGVASEEAYRGLLELQQRAGLPSLSQAVGRALDEWLQGQGEGVLNSEGGTDGSGLPEIRGGRSEPNKLEGGEDDVS